MLWMLGLAQDSDARQTLILVRTRIFRAARDNRKNRSGLENQLENYCSSAGTKFRSVADGVRRGDFSSNQKELRRTALG
jgi:hypothetical protein